MKRNGLQYFSKTGEIKNVKTLFSIVYRIVCLFVNMFLKPQTVVSCALSSVRTAEIQEHYVK